MNRLDTEHLRLFPTDHAVLADGRVRHMVLGVAGPADWPALGAVWRGVQADLDLPAPAIAVNGVDAFELWFSLADAVPTGAAAAFLDNLCARYLPDLAPARRRQWPALDASLGAEPAHVPRQQAATGHWSAFVAPDLAAVFGDDPSLDLPPGADAQAELLSRLKPIARAEFQLAMARLTPEPGPFLPSAVARASAPSVGSEGASAGSVDPRRFLLNVMNDPSVAMDLRIKAAKALLQP